METASIREGEKILGLDGNLYDTAEDASKCDVIAAYLLNGVEEFRELVKLRKMVMNATMYLDFNDANCRCRDGTTHVAMPSSRSNARKPIQRMKKSPHISSGSCRP